MSLTLDTLAALPPAVIRGGLATWVAHHCDAPAEVLAALEATLQAHIDAASDAEIERLQSTFNTAGEEWKLYPADPLARVLTRAYMGALTQPWSLEGGDRLDAFLAPPGRKMVVCNHLSYTDTQVTDSVLALSGRASVANRLVAVAGPKVYTETWRRMAAIALNTRKTAQSSTVASEQGSMSPRELAVVAIETLADCARLMDEGYLVLLYPEGTRSRDGRLQPFLRAASRYLAVEGVTVLPLAQTGGERLYPIDAPRMFRGATRLAFGEPFQPADFPGKTAALEEIHCRLMAELPEAYHMGSGASVA